MLAQVTRQVLRHAVQLEEFAHAGVMQVEPGFAELALGGVLGVLPLPRAHQPGEPFKRGRCMGGDVTDRIVLEHAAARDVAALRLLLAPGGDLYQDRQFFRLAHPRLQPLPGALRVEVVGPR